jgi:hypothetical protein
MRFLAAVGILVLVVVGYALQTHFSSNRVAEAEIKPGMSVYDVHANKQNVKTLPEEEAPLP